MYHSLLSPKLNNWCDFEFRVLYFVHDRDYNFSCRHTHEFYELVVVRDGSAEHILDGTRSRIHAGSVFFMHPGELHYYSQAHKLGIYNILFSTEFIEQVQKNFPAAVIAEHFFSAGHYAQRTLPNDAFRRLLGLLDEVLEEQQSNLPGARLQVFADALKILLLISRNARPADSLRPDDMEYRIGQIVEKLNNDPAAVWTLERMSRLCGLSESGFRRQFHRLIGASPVRYLLTLRLEKAALLLKGGQLPIAEIAARCGFDDSNYFARCFHRKFGCSPRAYRREEQP